MTHVTLPTHIHGLASSKTETIRVKYDSIAMDGENVATWILKMPPEHSVITVQVRLISAFIVAMQTIPFGVILRNA